MLYLISGASRSGKSMLAKRLLHEREMPYLSTDWLMKGFNDGIPECGIHHLLWPDDIAERMWSFLEGLIEALLLENVDYVIEGEAILPGNLVKLSAKYPGKIRMLFLGFAEVAIEDKVAQTKRYPGSDYDWLVLKDDDYIRDHIGNMIRYSRTIRGQCEQHRVRFIDASHDFPASLDMAYDYLLGPAPGAAQLS